MSSNATESADDWKVSVETDTVVVDLPPGTELDQETGKRINEAFAEAVARPRVDGVLTLLRVEDPLGSGLFDEVQAGADLAAANGIGRWAIVVEERVKGMAFESQIDGLDTAVFESEPAARSWLA